MRAGSCGRSGQLLRQEKWRVHRPTTTLTLAAFGTGLSLAGRRLLHIGETHPLMRRAALIARPMLVRCLPPAAALRCSSGVSTMRCGSVYSLRRHSVRGQLMAAVTPPPQPACARTMSTSRQQDFYGAGHARAASNRIAAVVSLLRCDFRPDHNSRPRPKCSESPAAHRRQRSSGRITRVQLRPCPSSHLACEPPHT